MTSEDLAWGVRITLAQAHRLKAQLGRLPATCEIRWRVASRLQVRWPHLERRSAMRMAAQFMDVVRTASSALTTS